MQGYKFRKTLYSFLTIVIVIVFSEIISGIAIKFYDNRYNRDKHQIKQIREVLMGKQRLDDVMEVTSQPYLLYIPSPKIDKHNKDGYRGTRVPLTKEYGVYRILFMGGSTTYSYCVMNQDSTFPAQTKKILDTWLQENKIIRPGISKIEVINAGIPWGTSAEILTHYLFKFRYYDPDLIVINTGGNDAYAHFLGANYQPDYNHFRKTMNYIYPAHYGFRWLFNSNLFSFFSICMFQENLLSAARFDHDGNQIRTRWFVPNDCEKNPIKNLHYNAFYNNLNTVINEMKSAGSQVLLVPFLANWEDSTYIQNDSLLQTTKYYIQLVKEIAVEQKVNYAPFDTEVITQQSYWLDYCHLSGPGIYEKANHIGKYILQIMNGTNQAFPRNG